MLSYCKIRRVATWWSSGDLCLGRTRTVDNRSIGCQVGGSFRRPAQTLFACLPASPALFPYIKNLGNGTAIPKIFVFYPLKDCLSFSVNFTILSRFMGFISTAFLENSFVFTIFTKNCPIYISS